LLIGDNGETSREKERENEGYFERQVTGLKERERHAFAGNGCEVLDAGARCGNRIQLSCFSTSSSSDSCSNFTVTVVLFNCVMCCTVWHELCSMDRPLAKIGTRSSHSASVGTSNVSFLLFPKRPAQWQGVTTVKGSGIGGRVRDDRAHEASTRMLWSALDAEWAIFTR
jgi:hypothetical protein